MRVMEQASPRRLQEMVSYSGFVAITAEDDAFFGPDLASLRRHQVEQTIAMVLGDQVRDYVIDVANYSVWPYDQDLNAIPQGSLPHLEKALWPNRRVLQRRKRFGTPVEEIPSLKWWEFGELYREKIKTPLSIAYAEVATHNHFVLDRGGKVFKQTAPVIKLRDDATDNEYLTLLGVLNSSTVCFWLKQVCFARATLRYRAEFLISHGHGTVHLMSPMLCSALFLHVFHLG